ncbi:MAG: extracellular solute-binding protein [Actinomycetota bacterium]|nr:extracellular solute-binding protein [Actinomycetota bacterium]
MLRYSRLLAALAVCLGVELAVAVVGSACPQAGAAQRATHADHRGSGPVDVLYAGSLVTLMQTTLDAAFHRATGYEITGIPGGSTALANEIKGGVERADVFVSASPAVNRKLEGQRNGAWESWYVSFATSALRLGYNPRSKFARTLRRRPWWQVVTDKGFLLGRTNPVTDPKGVLAVRALVETSAVHHDPALRALATTPSNVFPEQTMVGRLQAGELDAGFFYSVEASAAKIPTVALTGISEHATYTISVLAHAPHRRAAVAFVRFLLGKRGRALLEKNGLRPVVPAKLSGRRTAVPRALQRTIGR